MRARESFERRILTSWCQITDPLRSDEGTLNRTTGVVTFDDPAYRYEGPCSISRSQSSRAEAGTAPAMVDEHRLRILSGNQGVLQVGQNVRVRDHDGAEWTDWTVIRVPSRTRELTTHCIVQRRTYQPTTAGAAS